MIKSLSNTSLGMALRCQEQFKRRYINGEIIPPGVALLRGIGTHKGAEVNHVQKVKTLVDLPLDVMLDAARDAFVKDMMKRGLYLTREEVPAKKRLVNAALNETIKAVTTYAEEIAPGANPIAVESKFDRIDIGVGIPLVMRTDWLEAGDLIRDLKTSAKKWGANRIADDQQPKTYSVGYYAKFGRIPKFQFDFLILRKSRSGELIKVESDRAEISVGVQDIKATLEKFHAVVGLLESGSFMPTDPGNWWCGPKYCGYWYTCRFVGNGSKRWI